MPTVNNRIKKPQSSVINGVDSGGLMTAFINCGYEQIMTSPFDGLSLGTRDKYAQFRRGSIVSQDFSKFYSLLTGTVGTLVFYERKSGTAEATGWMKHTITNPVIHNMKLSVSKEGFSTISYSFECKAADPTKGFADMWSVTDSQSAPTYVAAARGGWRVVSTTHGAVNIYHTTAFDFSLAAVLTKESNDGDIAYTCVELDLPWSASGSISFQDATITSSKLKCQDLIAAVPADLTVTLSSSGGAANKVITIANVDFDNASSNSDIGSPFTGYQLPFGIADDPDTPLTLGGSNKIITIA